MGFQIRVAGLFWSLRVLMLYSTERYVLRLQGFRLLGFRAAGFEGVQGISLLSFRVLGLQGIEGFTGCALQGLKGGSLRFWALKGFGGL